MEATAYAYLANASRHLGDLFKAEDFYKPGLTNRWQSIIGNPIDQG